MGKQKGNRPTHRLKVLDKVTGQRDRVGAGWLNKDGSITIRLNMCVVLSENDLMDRVLTLFPADGDFDDDGNKAKDSEAAGP